MKHNDKTKSTDDVIEEIVDLVDTGGVTKYRGKWFSNRQVNNLRDVLERHGYEKAHYFQMGKVDPRDHPNERKKNELLVEIIDRMRKAAMDLQFASYIISKLNSVLDQKLEGEN